VRIIDHVRGYRSAAINALIDAVRAQRIVPGPGLRATETPGGTALTLDRSRYASPSRFRLRCTLSRTTLTVSAGSVRFHGVGTAAVAETSIECAMSPMWVYVKVARESLVATVEAMSSEPDSDYVNIYLPLVVVEGADESWSITEICHEGDFDFDLPLR
jgi:hypothetical protein